MCVCVCVSILKRVIREGLSEKVTFEQRPDLGVEVGRHVKSVGICMNLCICVCECSRF